MGPGRPAGRFGAPNPAGAFRSVPIANPACNSADLVDQFRAAKRPGRPAGRPIWGSKPGRSVPERSGAFRWPIPLAIRPIWWPDFGPERSGRPAGPALGNRPIWGSKTMTPLRYSGPPKKGGPHKLAVWGSAFWRLQSLFPPKGQSIWRPKSGRSFPERSDRQPRLQFGRFGGPISGRKAAGPAGRPADLGLRTRPGRPGAFRSVPERSGAFRSVPERSGAFRSPTPLAIRPIWWTNFGPQSGRAGRPIWVSEPGRGDPERSGAFRSPIPLAIRPIWWPDFGSERSGRAGAWISADLGVQNDDPP